MHLIMTRCGLAFDVTCPEPTAIRMTDLAYAMADIVIQPGRTRRTLCLAEWALAVSEVLERDRGMTDPAGLMAGLLSEAHRAYMPLLDPDHKSLWGPKLIGIFVSLRQAIQTRFAVKTSFGGYGELIKSAAMRVDATVIRDLSFSTSRLVFATAQALPDVDWLDLTATHRADVEPTEWACRFIGRFEQLEALRALRPTTFKDEVAHD